MQDCEEPRSCLGSANLGDNFTVSVGRGICFANITAAGRLTSTERENSIPNGDVMLEIHSLFRMYYLFRTYMS